MKRPLLITDCDEVLLHMITPLSQWLDQERDITLPVMDGLNYQFVSKSNGEPVPRENIWPLVADFFTGEMHRQTLAPGADAALATIAEVADVVVLTNLIDKYHGSRVKQLDAHGIRHRIVCNQGDKGEPVKALIEEYDPSVAVFVDDMDNHHASVATFAPDVWRVHMIVEPLIAGKRPPAPAAHVRIDNWKEALPWIMARFAEAA